MKGIFIPEDILERTDIDFIEKGLLSIYRYYAVEGKKKYCYLTNEEIADMLKISERYIQKIKKHLKELGLIRTDGGRRTYYLETGVNHSAPQGEPECQQRVNYSTKKGALWFTHNKEMKNNKENKKEFATNFEQVIDRLPDEYKDKEKIDYLYSKYKDSIDNINKMTDIDSGIVESWVVRVKSILMKECPISYEIKEIKEIKEEESNYLDF